jgi:hypothetical protein
LPISISFASSPLVGPIGHSVIPTMFLAMLLLTEQYAAKKQRLQEK